MSSNRSEEFFATAPRGLESLLAKELQSLGTRDAREVPGGVSFRGAWETCYRVNLWSRIASRLLWKIGEFPYRSEDEVYAAAKAVDWPRYFAVDRPYPRCVPKLPPTTWPVLAAHEEPKAE